MMSFVRPVTLLTSSNATWTTTQEKTIARDFPFVDLHLESPDQFVVRTYLQFLWLPPSIMPLDLLVPSLRRVQDASPRPPDSPHPLHALLDPLLLSLRAAVAKYHTDLPQILAHDGGDGEVEESMMWYALGYEIGLGEGSADTEDAARKRWLERLERRERVVQIQILLYLLKLSLPGPCVPLPSVTIPANNAAPRTRKKRAKIVTPTVQERLESFMDKLSIWQLVTNMDDANKQSSKDERDWTQTFCENVVERQFKSTLPDMCKLLRHKLFTHSPFEDEDDSSGSGAPIAGPSRTNANRKLARSSTSISVSQSKNKSNAKSIQRSSSVLSNNPTVEARSRSRSLSVSLAQDASARRSNSASATASSLKRALSREVSMSRGFKHRMQASQASQPEEASKKALAKAKTEAKKEHKPSQGITLVAATPTKPKTKGDTRNNRLGMNHSHSRSWGACLDTVDELGKGDDPGDTDSDGFPCKEDDEELWLPDSSPDVFFLGGRKRTVGSSSSSMGLSDPTEEGVDTPVKKRLRT